MFILWNLRNILSWNLCSAYRILPCQLSLLALIMWIFPQHPHQGGSHLEESTPSLSYTAVLGLSVNSEQHSYHQSRSKFMSRWVGSLRMLATPSAQHVVNIIMLAKHRSMCGIDVSCGCSLMRAAVSLVLRGLPELSRNGSARNLTRNTLLPLVLVQKTPATLWQLLLAIMRLSTNPYFRRISIRWA